VGLIREKLAEEEEVAREKLKNWVRGEQQLMRPLLFRQNFTVGTTSEI